MTKFLKTHKYSAMGKMHDNVWIVLIQYTCMQWEREIEHTCTIDKVRILYFCSFCYYVWVYCIFVHFFYFVWRYVKQIVFKSRYKIFVSFKSTFKFSQLNENYVTFCIYQNLYVWMCMYNECYRYYKPLFKHSLIHH